MEKLAYYTVELASPEGGWGRLPQLSSHARKASEQLAREGTAVRFVRSVFVPEDETCFYLYEAASLDDVHEAVRRAALPVERVAGTVGATWPWLDQAAPDHSDVTAAMDFEAPSLGMAREEQR